MISVCQDSAQSAVTWARSLLKGDGSFRDASHEVGAYYLAPLAFRMSGFPDLAEASLSYVKRTMVIDGDINKGTNDTGSNVATFRNAMLSMGTTLDDNDNLRPSLAAHLASMQNPKSGGVLARKSIANEKREIDLATTSATLLGMLELGMTDQAIMAGEHITQRMIATQPDPTKYVLFRQSWDGNWIDTYAKRDKSRYKLDLGATDQVYWPLGICMAALARLSQITQDSSFLTTCDILFDWANKCAPGAFNDLTAAKVGWGCSELFAATGQLKFKISAEQVATMLIDTQTPDGVWLRRPTISKIEDQPIHVTLDTTLERVCWLLHIARNLTP